MARVKVDQEASSIQFIYPFLFAAETFDTRVEAVQGAQWQGRERPLSVWQMDDFPESEILPHVARYLNPREGTPATARLWKLEGNALQSPFGLGSDGEWNLTLQQGEIPFQLVAMQLTLFRVGVGLLTVRAKPKTAELADWLTFLHYFRFIRSQRRVGVRLQRRTGFDPQTRQPQFSTFFPEPAGGIEHHPDGSGTLSEVLDALLRTGATEGESESWWDEVFIPGQLLPFAALFIDDMAEDEIPHLLYRARNFFHADQEIHPTSEDLQLENHSALLPYAKGQWFVFSLDGGAFVACDAPRTPFFRQTMPDHLRNEYFLLFSLVLHQRFVLMGLLEEVARHWVVGGDTTSNEERETAFERIRSVLLSFTARGHFAQVMQREHHHRCYRRWQEIFQVEQLYREVRDGVQEMHEYLLMRRTQRLEQLAEEQRQQRETEARAEAERERAAQERAQHFEGRVTYLGLLLGGPGLALSAADAIGGLDGLTVTLFFFGGLVFGAIMLAGLHYFRKRD